MRAYYVFEDSRQEKTGSRADYARSVGWWLLCQVDLAVRVRKGISRTLISLANGQ